jgi:hypothetical protein
MTLDALMAYQAEGGSKELPRDRPATGEELEE